ncbi:hypothetical protein [Rickettsia endosymbiont of Rhinocyllus conicus]|uniref:hypothetical protein n=1 Tax=Rickettsia endosymbiont of Rhinocyllus conicus TaxID=3066252 RepID=UPI003132D97E
MSSLKEQFDADKYFLTTQTNEFLANNKQDPLHTNRDEVREAVKNGNFTEALQKLEILREERTGITLTKIDPLIEGTTPIIIRDARNAKDPRELGMESFEMQYLNVIRAAIDIAEIEGKPEALKTELRKQAVDFIDNFHKDNEKNSQMQISPNVKDKINDIAILLENNGIKEVHKKLNVAKDFQNFNDEHCNIVTLSNIKDKNGKDHTVIEAEVALKGITDEQKAEYQNRADKDWFKKMPSWERQLVNKYAETIKEGEHVIPTQLRQIVGMKNAFEKITAIAEENKPIEIIHASKHAGTLASISRDKESQQRITDLNTKQAQEWMGDHKLHANTLNSGAANFVVPHPDAKLVTLTKRAIDHVGGRYTNTAFNKFRRIAGFNHFDGTKEQLNDLANNLPKETNFKYIATHLKPRGKLERLFGINKPKGDLKTMLNTEFNAGRLSKQAHEILTNAASLKQDIEKADAIFYRGADKENISSSISRKLNYLSNQISNSNDSIFKDVPKHETLTMCASGKDRTGLAEHDQTSTAIANRLRIEVKAADEQLLKAGHTAGQAGGVYAGGATIGCYGTLKVTAQGFPESRQESLKSMIEPSEANNKIKKLEKGQVVNEPAEQKKAKETPNPYQTTNYEIAANIQTPSVVVTTPKNELTELIPDLNKAQQQIIYKPTVELDNGGRITPNVTPAQKVNQRNKDNNIGR